MGNKKNTAIDEVAQILYRAILRYIALPAAENSNNS
jgi:hypothetical protein